MAYTQINICNCCLEFNIKKNIASEVQIDLRKKIGNNGMALLIRITAMSTRKWNRSYSDINDPRRSTLKLKNWKKVITDGIYTIHCSHAFALFTIFMRIKIAFIHNYFLCVDGALLYL